jgi:hypothetical protein
MPDGSERRIIAIALVGALYIVLIFNEGAAGSFMNLMFMVAGYYFRNGKTPRNGEV